MSDSPPIQVIENYKDFIPPTWVPKALSRLLCGVPAQYLRGLRIISLSNSEGLNRQRMRQKTLSRKHRVAIRETGGLYYQEWKGQAARIELFIDRIIQGWPVFILKFSIFQDVAIAGALFHELGHHIHKTIVPEHKEREDVADEWNKRLGNLYFSKKYWYAKPLGKLFRFMAWVSKLTHPKPQ